MEYTSKWIAIFLVAIILVSLSIPSAEGQTKPKDGKLRLKYDTSTTAYQRVMARRTPPKTVTYTRETKITEKGKTPRVVKEEVKETYRD